MTVAATRGCTYRYEDSLRLADRTRELFGEHKSAGARVALDNAVEVGLENRNFAAL